LGRNRWQDWLLCGLVGGAALVAKYTALLLLPVSLALAAGYWWPRRTVLRPIVWLRGVALAIGAALLVIGAVYNFSFDYALYWQGLRQIYTDYPTDGQYYLLGQVSNRPFWYYHLAAFSVKEPLPVLVLLALALVHGLLSGRGRAGGGGQGGGALGADERPSRGEAAWFLLTPVAAILAVSCFDAQNIGMRRILPAFPFLYLFCGSLLRDGWSGLGPWVRAGVALMLGWLLVEAWSIYPHHLSYLNTLAGGPGRGPYLLDDSNIDWGQDLPALAAWQEAHGQGRPLRLLYFGAANPAAYGVEAVPMEEPELLAPRSGLYAISAHNLVFFRMIHHNEGKDCDWLSKYQPVGKAGYSIFIYAFL